MENELLVGGEEKIGVCRERGTVCSTALWQGSHCMVIGGGKRKRPGMFLESIRKRGDMCTTVQSQNSDRVRQYFVVHVVKK